MDNIEYILTTVNMFQAQYDLNNNINWEMFFANPNADHLLIKEFRRELVENVFNPLRIQHIADIFNLDMEEYLELI
jgi:hypothetical protein